MSPPIGAQQRDWLHFDMVLGLGADLLPVVPDEHATPREGSKVKKFGKIPSQYDGAGCAFGIKDWTRLTITPEHVAIWSKDRRYSMCVRSSAVRAIDVDLTDPDLVDEVNEMLWACGLPTRTRANSPKFLLAFRLDGKYDKRIIDTGRADEKGKPQRIEFLGDGQQFVAAGSHPSGVLYEWQGGLPADIPLITSEQFEQIWTALERRFGTVVSKAGPTGAVNPAVAEDTAVLSTIDALTLRDLQDALSWPPLVKAAADNTTWSEIGYALLSIRAEEMWLQFSARAPNQENSSDPQDWWDAHLSQDPRSDYRHIFTLAKALSWRQHSDPNAFGIVEPDVGGRTEELQAVPTIGPGVCEAGVEQVPVAQSLCTDQANARRLMLAFQNRLRVVSGTFYAFDGRRWERNEGEASRCAALLSAMVKEEANLAYARFVELSTLQPTLTTDYTSTRRRDQSKAEDLLRAAENGEEIVKAYEKYESLMKWMIRCEDAARQKAALSLLRDLLTVNSAVLDQHHHLLNCLNGTIDLRTGLIRPHNPDDWITQLTPVVYDTQATCPRFKRFLVEVLDQERADFLQRWFGYCATGETQEQKVVLHIGPGGNGKGTLFRLLADVLGSYLHVGAPHLLTGAGAERHPTEIADLFGRRLVVSHESDEGAVLREGFLKQASGEDMMSGRFMFKDFFEFRPTFKLQLLTNKKPVVRGQDFGIWRRLLLLDYGIRYGSADQVASGEADKLGDESLTAQLLAEREGIFAWVVQGARNWYNLKLRPPASVQQASKDYREEQDRAKQFIGERCIIDAAAWSAYSGPFGLYPEYMRWCKDCGFQALTMSKFIDELARVLGPKFKRGMLRRKQDNVWKTIKGCYGVRVNIDQDGGGSVVTNNEDLL